MLKTQLFFTNYQVPIITPIFALSDIHADIDCLIIALRDCAKVIKKNSIMKKIDDEMKKIVNNEYKNISHKEAIHLAKYIYHFMKSGLSFTEALDECLNNSNIFKKNQNLPSIIERMRVEYNSTTLESFLNVDLNNDLENNYYNDDLGYEWCGNNSHVVIIGDILDGIRDYHNSYKKENNGEFLNQYLHVEIKILKFLNFLDEQAVNFNGRVFKLVGNHELMNFFRNKHLYSFSFGNISPKNLDFQNFYLQTNSDNYFGGLSRYDYFKIGNLGFELFKKRGTGIILKINNNIFVHGSINDIEKYGISYDDINNLINTNGDQHFNQLYQQLKLLFSKDSPLFDRKDGNSNIINQGFQYRYNNNLQKQYCDDVEERLINFCQKIESQNTHKIKCNDANLNLIVGHCVQYEGTTLSNQTRTTFTYAKFLDTDITETLLSLPYTGQTDEKQNVYFGITMDCENRQKKVFRVDIGQSRAFDVNGNIIACNYIISDPNSGSHLDLNTAKINQKKCIFSRTPQVLYIYDTELRIIRSKLENTRKNMPRDWFESIISTDTDTNNKHYIPQKHIPDLDYEPKNIDIDIQNGGLRKKRKYLKYLHKNKI
jgi:hypothetical protein